MTREIVAARIGTIITNDPMDIAKAIREDREMQFLDRRHMQLMASFDLGSKWQALADSPTLFTLEEEEDG